MQAPVPALSYSVPPPFIRALLDMAPQNWGGGLFYDSGRSAPGR